MKIAGIESKQAEGVELLDETLDRLRRNDYALGLSGLYGGLLDLRESMEPDAWRSFSTELAITHPLRDFIHRDPMIRRSFDKPRGYAGDAVLLDYIYGLRHPPLGERVANEVYSFSVSRPAATAVRERRERIAERIDQIARRSERPVRMLSIAAGHLREGLLSDALQSGAIDEFVALDSDSESLAVVRRTFPEVTIKQAPFTSLFRDGALLGRFDFVYSAGLYDYLQERMARRLTLQMFDLLRPGGTCMITNFLPSVVDAGFMESYMGWSLVYRDLDEIALCGADIPDERALARRAYADSNRAIGYLEVDAG